MKRNRQVEKYTLAICVTALIILVIIMIMNISNIQGDARVINYAGRVRGASQRLIKQELAGNENNELINSLDAILNELWTGEGNNSLNLINDKEYRINLKELLLAWDELKIEIHKTREDEDRANILYDLSESYYDLADKTVDSAEIYSARTASALKKLELIIIVISCVIIFIIIMLGYDFLHLSRLNKNLNELAYVDTLTGLPNRSYCELMIDEAGIIKKNRPVACFMFDLNNLKTTNDKLGHRVGDKLIISFANCLRHSAPKRMFLGRFGGDEFIGILKDTSEKEVNIFIKTLLDNTEEHNDNKENIEISFAYGYAISSSYNEITTKGLLAQADKKMYELKAIMKKQI